MQPRAYGNPVSDKSAEDLAPPAHCQNGLCRGMDKGTLPVEREPEASSCTLLFLGVPLTREKSKSWCHGSFEHAQEEPHSNRAAEIAHCCKASQGRSPHDNTK